MKPPIQRYRGTLVLAFAAAIAFLPGCSTDRSSPAAPEIGSTAVGAPAAGLAATSSAPDDSLQAKRDREKQRVAAEKLRSVTVYDSLHAIWAAAHARRGHPRRQATTMLQCEPQPYEADVQIVGPDGGLFHVGRHFFWIPKGALAQKTVITVEMPVSTHAELDFAPHGLRFGKSMILLSYRDCDLERSKSRRVVYTDDAYQIIETPASFDWKNYSTVRADISHFSHYVVAY
ncbi:MAG TPA: hypothetical protein VG432_10415 [Gemmatimonadaceae bacterium]|nr:hypothetical protein [Gemmatimonadaceae bacterium]